MVKQGYKQTEIGVIPEDWEVYTVRDLITLLTDYDANGSFSSVAENVKSYNYPEYAWYVRSTDLENKTDLSNVKYVDKPSYDFLKKTSLFGGELLFLKRGDIGNVYLFEMKTNKATLAPNLYLLKLNDISSSKYLYQYFISENGQKQLKSKNAGSTLGALYKDDVKAMLVPLPPLAEQEAIASALSDADAWIDSLEQLIAKKRLIKQGAMQSLLTPQEDWEVKKVREIAKVGRGRVISHKEINGSQTKKYPVYSSQTTNNGIMGFIDTYDFNGEYVTWTTDGEKAGTVFHRMGKFNCTNVCGTIQLNKDNAKFISYILGTITPKHVSRNLANPKLMNEPMKNIELPIPSLSEQERIATILSDMDAELESLENQLAKARQIKQGMMQELLTGRTRLV